MIHVECLNSGFNSNVSWKSTDPSLAKHRAVSRTVSKLLLLSGIWQGNRCVASGYHTEFLSQIRLEPSLGKVVSKGGSVRSRLGCLGVSIEV